MSTLDNRNELISGCRHSKKFLRNTVLTWLVLVANLTCCKHHLRTTRHEPTPRLAFIVLFYLMIRLSWGMTLWVAINVQTIIQSHQSTYIIHIHIYSLIKQLKLMQPPPPSIIERSTPKNTLSTTLLVIKLIHYQKKIPSSYYMPGAPNDGFLLNALRTLFRLPRVLLDL